MAAFNVTISRSDGSGALNLNVQVEAPDVLIALEAAKAQLSQTIEAAGLALASPGTARSGPTPANS